LMSGRRPNCDSGEPDLWSNGSISRGCANRSWSAGRSTLPTVASAGFSDESPYDEDHVRERNSEVYVPIGYCALRLVGGLYNSQASPASDAPSTSSPTLLHGDSLFERVRRGSTPSVSYLLRLFGALALGRQGNLEGRVVCHRLVWGERLGRLVYFPERSVRVTMEVS
jgi:hypothetical protein